MSQNNFQELLKETIKLKAEVDKSNAEGKKRKTSRSLDTALVVLSCGYVLSSIFNGDSPTKETLPQSPKAGT